MNRDTKPHRTSVLERIRNVLVLVPIFVTWAGLSWAATSYATAIGAEASLAERPFLLLWEQGFDGLGVGGPSFSLPLSLVAAIDAVVVLVIAMLTWIVHSQTIVAAAEHHVRTQALEDRLRDAVWAATLELRKRGSLSGAIDKFGRIATSLTDQVRAERQRVEELVNSRERRMGDLHSFAQDFGTAAQAMATSADDMAAKVAGATEANTRLAVHVEHLERTQADLGARLADLVGRLADSADAARQVAGGAEVAAGTLAEAAEAMGPGNVRIADSATQLRLEVAELRQQLERDSLSRRKDEAELTAKLYAAADQLGRSTTQVSRGLDQLSSEVASLRAWSVHWRDTNSGTAA